MKTIKKETINEIIINKSRFITHIIPISEIKDVTDILNSIKKKYKDATHYCYGYIINYKEKCSDDKEPQGTAGMPILNILKKEKLNNIICIVIRYFGGIKLGSNGLIRAYSASVKETLKQCQFGYIIEGYNITIEFDYNNIKNIDYILKGKSINKKFNGKIKYTFNITLDEYEKVKKSLSRYSNIIEKKETYVIKDGN